MSSEQRRTFADVVTFVLVDRMLLASNQYFKDSMPTLKSKILANPHTTA